MATTSRKPKVEAAELTRILVAILLGLSCFAAVITGGSSVGSSLPALLQNLETTSNEEIINRRWWLMIHCDEALKNDRYQPDLFLSICFQQVDVKLRRGTSGNFCEARNRPFDNFWKQRNTKNCEKPRQKSNIISSFIDFYLVFKKIKLYFAEALLLFRRQRVGIFWNCHFSEQEWNYLTIWPRSA